MAKNKLNLKKIKSFFKKKQKFFKKLAKNRSFIWLKKHGSTIGLAFTAFFLFILAFISKTPFRQAKEKILLNPQNFEARLTLAREYLNKNQFKKAAREISLAQSLEPFDYQLQLLKFQTQMADPEKINQLIKVWEELLAKKPDYRDGSLRLSLLYYQINEINKAREWLKKTLSLDPNYKPAQKWAVILGAD